MESVEGAGVMLESKLMGSVVAMRMQMIQDGQTTHYQFEGKGALNCTESKGR